MKTAVIYARYSSDNQNEQSIEGQLRVCQDYAERNDILILNTYIDRAMTGTNDNRPDFQQMIKDSSKREWDYVIVYKFDRFSRNKYEMAMHKKTLKDNNVKLLSAMEYIPDSPEAILIESMLEGYAEYYSAELSQKVKRGMHETRLKGYFQGGFVPYGYKVENRKIVIDEEQAEVVQYIFKQYANGVYVRQIIDSLTANGILNKNKPFAVNTIYHILRSEKYIGKYTKNNIDYDMYPRIIDNETFEKVRSKTKVNHYGKRSVKTIYLLRNKLICGYCGKPISAETGTSRHGVKVNYYKCLGIKKYRNGCQKETMRKDILEQFILDTIIEEMSKPNIMDIVVKNLMKTQEELYNNNQVLIKLQKAKKQFETQLNNILNAIELGVVNKTTNARMKELESQIEDMERQILIEQSKASVRISEEDIRKYYSSALKQESMLLINYLIKEIKLYNNKAEITFNSPLRTSPNNTGLSFLSITRKIKSNIRTMNIDLTINFYI